MSDKKKKSWFGKHKILTGIIIFIVFMVGMNSLTDTKELNNNSSQEGNFKQEIELIQSSIKDNSLNIDVNKLEAIKNPLGEGVVVYYPETDFSGTERNILWYVSNAIQGYALNSPSKTMTNLPWLREAEETIINLSGINKFSGASDLIPIIFK